MGSVVDNTFEFETLKGFFLQDEEGTNVKNFDYVGSITY